MAGWLHVGEMGALALHVMLELYQRRGLDPEAKLSAAALAQTLDASPHTLHKVMTRLVAGGMVDSSRGPNGGFRLLKGMETTSLAHIIETVEGRHDNGECLFAKRVCPADRPCIFHGLTRDVSQHIKDYFDKTTLGDVAGVPTGRGE